MFNGQVMMVKVPTSLRPTIICKTSFSEEFHHVGSNWI